MTNKLKNSYKTISEVVKLLNLENPKKLNNQSHTIRYWETQFKQIKPIKINNRRYYDQRSINILIKIGFASSNSDYKRNLQNSAYKINNLLVKNENEVLSEIHLNEKIIKISFGKKKHYLIKII